MFRKGYNGRERDHLPCVPEILSLLDFLMGCFGREGGDERHRSNAGLNFGKT